MAITWDHPQLGRLTFRDDAWQGSIRLPAFEAFRDEEGETTDGESPIVFCVDDESGVPSEEAVAMVLRIVANQAALVTTITKALWDDFHGEGPNSGMWWHGNVNQVVDSMFREAPLTSPQEICAVLQPGGMRILTNLEELPVVAEIDFHARFEEEHGVGILTDGSTVLGIGYALDVMPFRWVERYLAGDFEGNSKE